MKIHLIVISILAALLFSCSSHDKEIPQSIRIISWGGIGADRADTLYALAKECGFDTHLGLYRAKESALVSMDAAARKGIDVIISFPQIKDSTESAVALIKEHPALYAYHLKDEPDTSDFGWLADLSEKIKELDPSHPCYINLLPNWAWGVEEYAENLEMFASEFDLPFYSFDNYPIVEVDECAQVRPDWYRNLEEFSDMARSHGKPFWGFALAKAHTISDPWPNTVYPEPTLGQLRLQVFSNLLYGAQAIQYFNFTGIVDPLTCEKLPAFDLISQVNSEIKAYSPVFAGCTIKGVWHTGDSIPASTHRLESMPHKKIKSLEITGNGGVIALIENRGNTYLAIQNRDCINPAILEISFKGKVKQFTGNSSASHRELTALPSDLSVLQPIALDPGNLVIFTLED